MVHSTHLCGPALAPTPGWKREHRRFEGGLGRARLRRTRPPTCHGCAPGCAGARNTFRKAGVGYGEVFLQRLGATFNQLRSRRRTSSRIWLKGRQTRRGLHCSSSPRAGGPRRVPTARGRRAHLVESAGTVRLRTGWAGLLAPHEAASLPGLRSGLRRRAPRLQVGRGGPRGIALVEAWRYFKPAAGAQFWQ